MVSHLLLVSVRLSIVVVGVVLAVLSHKAYRKNNSRPLMILAIAFVFITLGAIIEGVLFEFVSYSLIDAHIIESAVTAVGLATVLYAIHVSKK